MLRNMDNLSRKDLEARLAAIVVVGGAALALAGHVGRTTQDVDVYARVEQRGTASLVLSAQPLPPSLARAAATVARDFGMPADWMNSVVSPAHLVDPPDALLEDLAWRRFGALRVGVAGRRTLIALKLHAVVDRDRDSVHLQDLRALRPSDAELASARAWVVRQDRGPQFPQLVDEVIGHVRTIRNQRS
jgi:Nucleotidyltransferase of unknown function (DUF6036)